MKTAKNARSNKLSLAKETIASMTVRSDLKAGMMATGTGGKTGKSDACTWPSCAAGSALLNPNC